MKKKIAIVYGGDSDEWIISRESAATVYNNLDTEKYRALLVKIQGNEWLVENIKPAPVSINRKDFSFELDGTTTYFDGVFIVIHGTPGEDGKLQGYFDMIGIPYNTCSQLVSAITFHKGTTIKILKSHGVACANSVVINKRNKWSTKEILNEVKLPCFVKPNSGGSSFGISKVLEENELEAAVNKAFAVDREVMIEELMVGREVTNGAYSNKGKVVVMPVTEIISKNEFFDYAAKYQGEADEITPADIGSEKTKEIRQLTAKIYDKLNLEGLIRVDYIIQNDIPHVIEVNTTPGLSGSSLIPQQAAYIGLSLKDLFDQNIQDMFYRSELK